MKSTIAGVSRSKADVYLSKRRMMMMIKALKEANKKETEEYNDNIDLYNKYKSYMVGSTLFE